MKFKINVYESVCEVISASDLSPRTLCCDCTHGCSAKAFRLSRSGPQGGLFTALPPGPSALTLPDPRHSPTPHQIHTVCSARWQRCKKEGPILTERHSQPSWERLTRNQTKCGVRSARHSAPGCHGNRVGACNHKNEHSSFHPCIAFSFSRRRA